MGFHESERGKGLEMLGWDSMGRERKSEGMGAFARSDGVSESAETALLACNEVSASFGWAKAQHGMIMIERLWLARK